MKSLTGTFGEQALTKVLQEYRDLPARKFTSLVPALDAINPNPVPVITNVPQVPIAVNNTRKNNTNANNKKGAVPVDKPRKNNTNDAVAAAEYVVKDIDKRKWDAAKECYLYRVIWEDKNMKPSWEGEDVFIDDTGDKNTAKVLDLFEEFEKKHPRKKLKKS
jgi:hypothetical protein